jgi:hypothetical protein
LSSQSQICVTTEGQPAGLLWCEAPVWGLRPDVCYCQTVAGLLIWGALSDERTVLPFTVAAGPRQRSHSWVLCLYINIIPLILFFLIADGKNINININSELRIASILRTSFFLNLFVNLQQFWFVTITSQIIRININFIIYRL